jgi:5-methylcytosine-specific restriction protein A
VRGLCPLHARDERQARYQRNAEHLYDARWKAASRDFIAGKTCIDCHEPAELTDHSRPHRGDRALFWDRSLWVPRCWRCHSRKTVLTDGGFGRTAETSNLRRHANDRHTPNQDEAEDFSWG